ncbi:hypothetical protein Taro_055992, partial [Colocasia esculenta]|nr:hypothetical protein [Colocasia esculenta]
MVAAAAHTAATASSSSQHLSPIPHGLRQCSQGATPLHSPSTSRCLLPISCSSSSPSFPQDPIFFDQQQWKRAEEGAWRMPHRGQEGADIVSCDGGTLKFVTGLGLVSEVFGKDLSRLDALSRDTTVGHVRYSTAGVASSPLNVHPFLAGYHFGEVAVAHNRNLVNYAALRCGRWR